MKIKKAFIKITNGPADILIVCQDKENKFHFFDGKMNKLENIIDTETKLLKFINENYNNNQYLDILNDKEYSKILSIIDNHLNSNVFHEYKKIVYDTYFNKSTLINCPIFILYDNDYKYIQYEITQGDRIKKIYTHDGITINVFNKIISGTDIIIYEYLIDGYFLIKHINGKTKVIYNYNDLIEYIKENSLERIFFTREQDNYNEQINTQTTNIDNLGEYIKNRYENIKNNIERIEPNGTNTLDRLFTLTCLCFYLYDYQ